MDSHTVVEEGQGVTSELDEYYIVCFVDGLGPVRLNLSYKGCGT
jgi:hypothetical protein